MLLGNFYKKTKRPQDAIAAYRDALARDDEHQNALFSLAIAYKDEGRFDEARVGFERARELDPRNGKVLWQLADLWMRQGDFARAEAIVNDALERQGRRAPVPPEARRDSDRGEAVRRGRARAQARAREEAGAGARALRPRPRPRRQGTARPGDRRPTRRSSRPTRRPTARRSTPRSCCRRVGRAERGDRAFPQGGRDRADVRHRPARISPRRCSTTGDLGRRRAVGAQRPAEQPEPRIAPLGHYVLADVYEQHGRMAEAKREVAAAERLKQARQP